MDNANYQADLESFLRSGLKTDLKDKKRPDYIYRRYISFGKKITVKDVYDSMIRSDVKFPTAYKQKRKLIEFNKLAGCQPTIVCKRKYLSIRRYSKNTKKVYGIDLGAVKQAVTAVKGAVQGEDGGMIITSPEQYFDLLCEAMFQLMYDRISEKGLKAIRKY